MKMICNLREKHREHLHRRATAETKQLTRKAAINFERVSSNEKVNENQKLVCIVFVLFILKSIATSPINF